MPGPNDIVDYSMIDTYLKQSADSARAIAFSQYDANTGYFNQQQPAEEVEQDIFEEQAARRAANQQVDQEEEEQNAGFMADDEGFDNSGFEEDSDWEGFDDDDEDASFPGDLLPALLPTVPEDGGVPAGVYGPRSETPRGAPKGGTIAESHKNPGNLKFSKWMEKYGATKGRPGQDGGHFAVFPDFQAGLAARTELLTRPLYQKRTVDEAMKLYSNQGYGAEIYPEIANKKMSELTKEQLAELTRRQVKREDVGYAKKLGIKQAGGTAVARTPEQQYIGLNDGSLDELILPLQGINTIRGLDSGQPVEIIDETGVAQVLYGPNHIVKAKGKVKEKRLK